jgi:hypothetical protein
MTGIYPDGKRPDLGEEGHVFQDFVCLHLAKHGIIIQNFCSRHYQWSTGENIQGFEIKLDNPCHSTGRLSIEIAEKTRADSNWVPSGIYRQDNSWIYIQGNTREFFIFSKKRLLYLHKVMQPPEEETPTVRKFYLEMYRARREAEKVFDLRSTAVPVKSAPFTAKIAVTTGRQFEYISGGDK